MIQYKLIDKRFTQSQLLGFFNENVEGLTKEVLRGMVDAVLQHSPVDTGTYVESHEVTLDARQGGYGDVSSHGRPRKVAREPVIENARQRMYAAIDGFTANSREASIRNVSAHANFVEYGRQPFKSGKEYTFHSPYRKARAETNNIITEARIRFEGIR